MHELGFLAVHLGELVRDLVDGLSVPEDLYVPDETAESSRCRWVALTTKYSLSFLVKGNLSYRVRRRPISRRLPNLIPRPVERELALLSAKVVLTVNPQDKSLTGVSRSE